MGVTCEIISQGPFLIHGEILSSPVGVHPISSQWVILAEPVAMLGTDVKKPM